MVKNLFKLVVDTIIKNLVVSKIFLKKNLELSLYNWVFDFEAIFMLVLLLNYRFVIKQNGKKDGIGLVGPSNF